MEQIQLDGPLDRLHDKRRAIGVEYTSLDANQQRGPLQALYTHAPHTAAIVVQHQIDAA